MSAPLLMTTAPSRRCQAGLDRTRPPPPGRTRDEPPRTPARVEGPAGAARPPGAEGRRGNGLRNPRALALQAEHRGPPNRRAGVGQMTARALLAQHRRDLEAMIADNRQASVNKVTRHILDSLDEQARDYLKL